MATKRADKTFLWITEEWLIILIAILILLAIAIGAAGARTLITNPLSNPAPTTMSASSTGSANDKE